MPGSFALTPSELKCRAKEYYNGVKKFISEEIEPVQDELMHHEHECSLRQAYRTDPKLLELTKKARGCGLWNMFIPLESDPAQKYGCGLTNLEYAHICELLGQNFFAPFVFNCSAPDTGNIEILVRYGTEEQKQKWLVPLLNGEIRSCFAMTEPAVASSDATNIKASIRRNGNEYILNGHKWWISGIMDPRCKLCIFMGKTDPDAHRYRQQSMILVPMDTPGIKVVRGLTAFGFFDNPGGHGEVTFENVHVPASNLLLGEGRGFEIAQGRLGPGRIHHCMRQIGVAERCLELLIKRAAERETFGKKLLEQGTIQADIANCRIEIEQTRLLVLKAAHMMDTVGNKAATPEIAMIKVATPNMTQRVVDRTMQVYGAAAFSPVDTPFVGFLAAARILRIADGPDEVHRRTVARIEIGRALRKSKL